MAGKREFTVMAELSLSTMVIYDRPWEGGLGSGDWGRWVWATGLQTMPFFDGQTMWWDVVIIFAALPRFAPQ